MGFTQDQFTLMKHFRSEQRIEAFTVYGGTLRTVLQSEFIKLARPLTYPPSYGFEDAVADLLVGYVDKRQLNGILLADVPDEKWEAAVVILMRGKSFWRCKLYDLIQANTPKPPLSPAPQGPPDPSILPPEPWTLAFEEITAQVITAGMQLFPRVKWTAPRHPELLEQIRTEIAPAPSEPIDRLRDKHNQGDRAHVKKLDKKLDELERLASTNRANDETLEQLEREIAWIQIMRIIEPLNKNDLVELLSINAENADKRLQRYRRVLGRLLQISRDEESKER
jgi:hypothetical protein